MRISTDKVGKLQKIGRQQALIYAISGFVADFLRSIDVNAGGFRLKKGQGFLHPRLRRTQPRVEVLHWIACGWVAFGLASNDSWLTSAQERR